MSAIRTTYAVSLLCFVLMAVVLSRSVHRKKTLRKDFTKEKNQGLKESKEKERWLEDEIFYPMYDYQGDAPLGSEEFDDARCPPYPEDAPVRACRARVCTHDKDCRHVNQRCCFNGCKFTCSAEMVDPAVVDWRKEPRRQSQTGTSWLIKGPDEPEEVETCTTTKDADDGDPLLCPHGYVCHIEDPGDPKIGLPNRGLCIKQRNKEEENRPKQKILHSELRASGMCLLGTTVVRDQTIILRGINRQKCLCHRGTIQCGKHLKPRK